MTARSCLRAVAPLVGCLLSLAISVGTGHAQDVTAAHTDRTVWDGVYSDEQAGRGGRAYGEHCAQCHGADLKGGEYRALVGDRFWTSWQETTVDALLDHVSTTMPHSEDGSLKGTLGAAVYADILAYILSRNGFPAGATELTTVSSAGVRIIREGGSEALPDGSFVQISGCLAPRADGDWRLENASPPARVDRTGGGDDPDGALGHREYPLLFVITPLDAFVGHRMTARGTLVGASGADGLNVSTVTSVADTCP